MKDLAASQDTPPVPTRDRLKRATRSAHVQTEARWFASGKFDSRAHYDQWLQALLETHAIFGAAAVKPAALQGYMPVESARRKALARDLGTWHSSRSAKDPVSESWSWGVLYALNGSALGASVLLKAGVVQRDWPSEYLQEMRHFATSGALQSFFQRLNATPADAEGMEKGARDVFDHLAAPV